MKHLRVAFLMTFSFWLTGLHGAKALAQAALPSSCFHPGEINCGFYRDCLETRYSCGELGYPLGYGEKYCERFLTLNTPAAPFPERISEAGIQWRDSVLVCLQKALVPVLAEAPLSSCEEVTDYAFDSHPGCYTQPGNSFCSLPFSDWLVIEKIIGFSDLLSPRGFKQVASVLKTCALPLQSELKQIHLRLELLDGDSEFLEFSGLLEERAEIVRKLEHISNQTAP